MRQYYSNNKNYNAILESMAQIRQNQLNEAYGGMPHHGGGMSGAMDRMAQGQIPLNAEAMYDDEEEMEERYMYEGEHEDDEDAQMEALAEMMDEALMELDDEDDEDQMLGEAEEDDERRARRRARLRNALLIGAGLVATGGLAGAAMANPAFRQGLGTAAMGAKDFIGNMIKAPGKTSQDALTATQAAYKTMQGVPSVQGAAAAGQDVLDATQAAMGADVGARDYNRMALPASAKFDSDAFSKGLAGARARRGASQQMVIDPKALRRAAATQFASDIPAGI